MSDLFVAAATSGELETLSAIQQEVGTRRFELSEAGADIQRTVPRYRVGASYVEVTVKANAAAARELLADFGDKVRVVQTGGAPNDPRLGVRVPAPGE